MMKMSAIGEMKFKEAYEDVIASITSLEIRDLNGFTHKILSDLKIQNNGRIDIKRTLGDCEFYADDRIVGVSQTGDPIACIFGFEVDITLPTRNGIESPFRCLHRNH